MSKLLLLNLLFVVGFIHISASSNCKPEEIVTMYGTTSVYYDSITCYNVTSQVLNDFENSTTINSLTIRNFSAVKKLSSNISLSKFTRLENLELSSLDIEEIAPEVLYGLVDLRTLNLYSNRLSKIGEGVFRDLKNLNELNLARNLLETVPKGVFNNLSSLQRLFLYDNLINRIEDNAFVGVVSLTDLYLERNNLTVLQDNVFKDLIKLESIGLAKNPLVEIGKVGFSTKIVKFNFENTLFQEWRAGTISHPVKILKITESYLKKFDFNTVLGSRYPSLIDLSNNKIIVIENLEKTNFTDVHLSRNFITKLPDISKRVSKLYLNSNKIKELRQITEPTKLRLSTLDLSYNEIETATCFGITSLSFLDLSNNHITVVTEDSFNACTELYELKLSGNQIQSIYPQSFKNLYFLYNLDISDNKLTKFNYDSFIGLKKTKHFYFEKNEINSLDIELLLNNMPELSAIDFDITSLFCDDFHHIFRSIKLHHLRTNFKAHTTNTDCKKKN